MRRPFKTTGSRSGERSSGVISSTPGQPRMKVSPTDSLYWATPKPRRGLFKTMKVSTASTASAVGPAPRHGRLAAFKNPARLVSSRQVKQAARGCPGRGVGTGQPQQHTDLAASRLPISPRHCPLLHKQNNGRYSSANAPRTRGRPARASRAADTVHALAGLRAAAAHNSSARALRQSVAEPAPRVKSMPRMTNTPEQRRGTRTYRQARGAHALAASAGWFPALRPLFQKRSSANASCLRNM